MLALAFLTIATAAERELLQPGPMVPLSRNEIAHLASAVITTPPSGIPHRLAWSMWRRQHQHRAMTCHYDKQATNDP